MNKISQEELNHIRTSVDIVDVVSNYIPLTKRGKNYFGVCPFHEDSDPSLSVSQDKQIFSCFSCHTSGNVFNFVQEYEHVSFIEAVKIVAENAGISINIGEVKHENTFESKMYEAYELSLKFYQNNINTKLGDEAKSYLHKRGITDELIKEFEIGLSLKKRDSLTNLLLKKGFDEKTLIDSGLSGDLNGICDLFRNRIMFPIHNINGKVVGYSGRIYNIEDTSKYINTKETAIFKKGETLYNYFKAKNECTIKDTVIITEGFMDVIRLYSVGIKNVIATMGTAVTKNHVNLIKRLASNVILLFDGDKAGAKATISCCDVLQDSNINVKIVRLEENLDPDEFILKYGKDKILSKLENAISILEFKSEYFKKGKNLSDDEDLALYVKQIIDEVSKTDDDILKEITLKRLALETNLDYEFLKSKVNSKKEIKKVKKIELKTYDKYTKAQMGLIHYMLLSSEAINVYDNQTFYLPDKSFRILAKEISAFYDSNGYINVADLVSNLDEESNKLIGEIESLGLSDEFNKDIIFDYIKSIRELNIEEQINRLTEKMSKENDYDKKIKLAQEIVELKMRSDEDVERS